MKNPLSIVVMTAGLGLMFLGYRFVYDTGFQARDRIAIAEKLEVAESNRSAIAEATRTLSKNLISVNATNERLEDVISQINAETADIGVAGCGISADSLRLIEAIK